jgi:hypothetical protein
MTYTDGTYTIWIANAHYSSEVVYHFQYPVLEFNQQEESK